MNTESISHVREHITHSAIVINTDPIMNVAHQLDPNNTTDMSSILLLLTVSDIFQPLGMFL